MTVIKVLDVLRSMRIPVITDEYELHNMIAEVLFKNDIPFQIEYKLGPRNRIDFLIAGGIGLEVKKRKPNWMQVYTQLARYADSDEIKAIILVIERSMDMPSEINGKPCYSVGLNKLWGIAL